MQRQHDTDIIIQFSLGAIADLDLAVRSKNIKEDIMVVSSVCACAYRYHLLVGASIQRIIATHAIVHVYVYTPYHSCCAYRYTQVAGDMLFSHNFDICQVLDYFKLKVQCTLILGSHLQMAVQKLW